MHKLIILFAFCYFHSVNGYKIPNAKLELLSQGFRVSIPDDVGHMFSVFYGIEINEKCPLIMEYVRRPQNGIWTADQTKQKVKTNDKVVLFIMVQYDDQVLKSTQKVQIGHANEFATVSSDEAIHSEMCIEAKPIGTVIDDRSCAISDTKVRYADNFCSGQSIFEENFDDGAELNQSLWTHDVRLRLNSYVSEFVVFDSNEKNYFIKDGSLHIVPTVTEGSIRSGSLDLGSRCTATVNARRDCSIVSNEHFLLLPPVHSAQIHTAKFFSFKYGRVEIRAKLPKGDWILPYILLQPASTLVDMEQPSNIRIAFARGNERLINSDNVEIGGSRLYGGIYTWNGPKFETHTKNLKREEHFGNDFHVYTLTWTKAGISVAVDGEVYGEINTNLNSFQEECYLIFGVSVGGHNEFEDGCRNGPTLTKKPWDNTSPKAIVDFWKSKTVWQKTWNGDEALKVDYVRVYAI